VTPRRVLILGAAGRDFHDFNVRFRDDPQVEVVGFTATQIPGIEGRTYPAALAGARYPQGLPIHPADDLERLIAADRVDEVVFSYSDVSHEDVMHMASRALAAGAGFRFLSPRETQLTSTKPVVAVCATRTGCGKSQTTRHVARALLAQGKRVAVVRHPMPYGDLARQRAQRFASYPDLAIHECTIEEREEYELHIAMGVVVHAGVDYEQVLRAAEEDADVILWDGGNNDLPFFRPDLHLTLVDPLRPGHELRYHPGEANVRAAHALLINKVDSASAAQVAEVRANLRRLNPTAPVFEAASPVSVDNPQALTGKRALVIEDGPTSTHGGQARGAGTVAALRYGATIVDPTPFAVGSIAATLARYPHAAPALPAMGYGAVQVRELQETIRAVPADVVVIGTPFDLGRLLEVDKPLVRASYELQVLGQPTLEDLLRERLG
jgi:predicted GTPase